MQMPEWRVQTRPHCKTDCLRNRKIKMGHFPRPTCSNLQDNLPGIILRAAGTTLPKMDMLGRPSAVELGSLMAWIYLGVAGLLEIVWAYSMKLSDGFTRLTPSIVTLVAMIASFGLLAAAMRSLPLGTAYAIWTGIGAVGGFVLGIIWLGEQASPARIISVSLIIAGIIGLKLSTDA